MGTRRRVRGGLPPKPWPACPRLVTSVRRVTQPTQGPAGFILPSPRQDGIDSKHAFRIDHAAMAPRVQTRSGSDEIELLPLRQRRRLPLDGNGRLAVAMHECLGRPHLRAGGRPRMLAALPSSLVTRPVDRPGLAWHFSACGCSPSERWVRRDARLLTGKSVRSKREARTASRASDVAWASPLMDLSRSGFQEVSRKLVVTIDLTSGDDAPLPVAPSTFPALGQLATPHQCICARKEFAQCAFPFEPTSKNC